MICWTLLRYIYQKRIKRTVKKSRKKNNYISKRAKFNQQYFINMKKNTFSFESCLVAHHSTLLYQYHIFFLFSMLFSFSLHYLFIICNVHLPMYRFVNVCMMNFSLHHCCKNIILTSSKYKYWKNNTHMLWLSSLSHT